MQSSYFNRLSQIKPLFYKRLVLNVYDFEMKDLKNLIKYERILYELAEEKMLINIFFDEKEIDVSDFRKYENISLNLYYQSLLTRFNYCKNLTLCYPQLFKQKDRFFNIKFNEIEAIFLYNHKNTDKIDLEEYFKKEGKQSFIFEINKETDDMSYSISIQDEDILKVSDKMDNFKLEEFNSCALGGSFDHPHVGHKVMLTTAALITNDSLYVGITSDEMISKKDSPEILQPCLYRKQVLEEFFRDIGFKKNLIFGVLNSTVGKAGEDASLEALVITEETLKGGNHVNEFRKNNNLSPVKLVFSEIISTQLNNNVPSFADKVSSSSIRKSIKDHTIFISECYKNWIDLCTSISISKEKSIVWFSILRDLYMQSWRRYHSLNHIYTYSSLIENAYKQGKINDYMNIALAVWFHDSIYVSSRGDNEERSVELFRKFYKDIVTEKELNIEKIDVEKVCFYIMCTKYHFDDKRYYDDIELNYFLDFDLFTFSLLDEESFMRISHSIREEYFIYNDKEWALGRIQFLNSLYSKEYLYRTQEYRDSYESIAKSNILKEINYYKQQL